MRSSLAWVRTAAALSAAVLFGMVSLHALAEEATGTRHVVEIREFAFVPAAPALAPGDTVVWINRDIVSHTATAEDGSWDSGEIEPGGRWEMVVGTSTLPAYFCAFHPSMKGRLAMVRF